MNGPRVVVVAKRSAWDRYVEEEADPRVRMLFKRRDPSVARWKAAHDENRRTIETVLESLEKLGARTVLIQDAHVTFDTSDAELVVSVGGDGTLLAASHNVDDVPILGVNSSPKHSVGFFSAARPSNVHQKLVRSLEGKAKSVKLSRMQVEVDGRVRSRRVLNDALFSHASPAATSRYIIKVGRRSEEQRSSGIWVGPAAGSTAAIRSAGGRILPLTSRKLQLIVREPYEANGRPYRLLRVLIDEGQSVAVHSKIRAALYLDGPYKEVGVPIGATVKFRESDQPLHVVGLTRRVTQPRAGKR